MFNNFKLNKLSTFPPLRAIFPKKAKIYFLNYPHVYKNASIKTFLTLWVITKFLKINAIGGKYLFSNFLRGKEVLKCRKFYLLYTPHDIYT